MKTKCNELNFERDENLLFLDQIHVVEVEVQDERVMVIHQNVMKG